MELTEKILSRCVQSGDCLIWQGARHKLGYGMVRDGNTMSTTHRAIGLEAHGDPGPSGTYKFTHTCGNMLCCNEKHIEVTTHKNIMQSSWTSHRAPKKHKNRAALTPDEIRSIRAEPDDTWGSKTRLAKKYGVTDQTISKIRRGKSYTWIE